MSEKIYEVDTGWTIDDFNQIDILELNADGEGEVYTGAYEILEESVYLDNEGNPNPENDLWYTYYAKVKVAGTELEIYNRQREWDEVSVFYLMPKQHQSDQLISSEHWLSEAEAMKQGGQIKKQTTEQELE